jgi:hypothetical protein
MSMALERQLSQVVHLEMFILQTMLTAQHTTNSCVLAEKNMPWIGPKVNGLGTLMNLELAIQ